MTDPAPTMTVLSDVETRGVHHGHRIRVLAIDGEIHVETSEPDGCGCITVRPLSEVVHLLANITDAEWWAISPRGVDAKGHVHR